MQIDTQDAILDGDGPASAAGIPLSKTPDASVVRSGVPLEERSVTTSGRQTATKAGRMLEAAGKGFFIPTPKQRQDLLIECATRGYASYARAFDILKVTKQGVDPRTIQIKADFDSIRICEIKSTNRDMGTDWTGYFFSLSTAELLIAQSLKERFGFVLVNTTTGSYLELTLTEVFARARAIYPSWSIRF